MRDRTVVWWLLAGWIGYAVLPWYAIDDGFWRFGWLVGGFPLDDEFCAGLLHALSASGGSGRSPCRSCCRWPPGRPAPIPRSGGFLIAALASRARRRRPAGFAIGLRGWQLRGWSRPSGRFYDRQFGMGYGGLVTPTTSGHGLRSRTHHRDAQRRDRRGRAPARAYEQSARPLRRRLHRGIPTWSTPRSARSMASSRPCASARRPASCPAMASSQARHRWRRGRRMDPAPASGGRGRPRRRGPEGDLSRQPHGVARSTMPARRAACGRPRRRSRLPPGDRRLGFLPGARGLDLGVGSLSPNGPLSEGKLASQPDLGLYGSEVGLLQERPRIGADDRRGLRGAEKRRRDGHEEGARRGHCACRNRWRLCRDPAAAPRVFEWAIGPAWNAGRPSC